MIMEHLERLSVIPDKLHVALNVVNTLKINARLYSHIPKMCNYVARNLTYNNVKLKFNYCQMSILWASRVSM